MMFRQLLKLTLPMLATVLVTPLLLACASGTTTEPEIIDELPVETRPVWVESDNVRQHRDFWVELRGCRRNGPTVTCFFVATSFDTDRLLTLSSPDSRAFDYSGNEYLASKAWIANHRGSKVEGLLVAGVPTRAAVVFEGVQPEQESLSLVDVGTYGPARLQFRDVPMVEWPAGPSTLP